MNGLALLLLLFLIATIVALFGYKAFLKWLMKRTHEALPSESGSAQTEGSIRADEAERSAQRFKEEYWKASQALRERQEEFKVLLDSSIRATQARIDAIPAKVMQSVNGSINGAAGKFGEVLTHLQLRAQYDRFIIANSISDFIGIKMEKDEKGEEKLFVSFIEAKTGKAVLSTEQSAVRRLIKEGKYELSFKVVRTELDEGK